jgi:hypothetical protein
MTNMIVPIATRQIQSTFELPASLNAFSGLLAMSVIAQIGIPMAARITNKRIIAIESYSLSSLESLAIRCD